MERAEPVAYTHLDVYKRQDEDDRKSAKEKTYSLGAGNADEFVTAFSGAVLNTRLVNAGQYTNVQNILKENADLFRCV